MGSKRAPIAPLTTVLVSLLLSMRKQPNYKRDPTPHSRHFKTTFFFKESVYLSQIVCKLHGKTSQLPGGFALWSLALLKSPPPPAPIPHPTVVPPPPPPRRVLATSLQTLSSTCDISETFLSGIC